MSSFFVSPRLSEAAIRKVWLNREKVDSSFFDNSVRT